MKKNMNDILGKTFGHLVVKERTENKNRGVIYLCECQCGKIISVYRGHLLSGNSTSCGCKMKNNYRHGHATKGKYSREYRIWRGMKNRCYNDNVQSYEYYGGRGIKVCDRWKNSFENFYEDMGLCPPGYSIERINNDGDYEPGNCKWATKEEQNKNKRNNVFFEYGGKNMILRDWAKYLRVSKETLWSRIYIYGWSIEKAFSTPVIKTGRGAK